MPVIMFVSIRIGNYGWEIWPVSISRTKLVLTSFIEAARAKGAADEFIYQLLPVRPDFG